MPNVPRNNLSNIQALYQDLTNIINNNFTGTNISVEFLSIHGGISIKNTPAIIKISKSEMPGRKKNKSGDLTIPSDRYRRIDILTKFPLSMNWSDRFGIEDKRNKFLFSIGDEGFVSNSLFSRIVHVVDAYKYHNQIIESRLKESQKMDEKIKNRKVDVEKRAAMFESLKTALQASGSFATGCVVETEFNDEYVNLRLPNNIVVRLQAEANGVALTEISLPNQFDVQAVDTIAKTVQALKGFNIG